MSNRDEEFTSVLLVTGSRIAPTPVTLSFALIDCK